MGEDVQLAVKRADIDFFYQVREELRDCLTELNKEVETNLLDMARDQHDIIYLNKLATTYNEIAAFLSTDFDNVLSRFKGVTFDIEPAQKPVIGDFQNIGGVWGAFMDRPFPTYWNEYVTEEQLIIKDADAPPIVIRLIATIAEGFAIATKTLYQAVTQSLVYKSHPELIRLIVPKTVNQENTSSEPEPVEKDKGLSAVQKLLLVRLLQQEGLFPTKPANTDDAPELRAIALLTGLNYENHIKGGNGANAKVNLLLDDRSRRSMSVEQAKSKLKDLDAVEKVAQLLNLQSVRLLIDKYRKELQPTLAN